MALIFNLPPARINRAPNDNPAECIATSGNLEFGLTIPRYNGIDITALQANDVTSPTVVNTQAPLALGTENFNAHAQVTAVPTHSISWPMILPPVPVNGVWTSTTKVSGRDLPGRLEIILRSRGEVGKPLKPSVDFRTNKSLLTARTMYTIHVKPMPSAQEFMNHIEYHECQHVADHRWLAERIIGRWDDWLQTLMTGNIRVVSKVGLGGLAVPTGFGYAVGVWRIVSYWCRAAAQSGDLYHDTPAGRHPVLNVAEITDNSVTITVTPREIIRLKPNLLIPSPHHDMVFQTGNLNGNEPRLTHGTPPVNPFRDSAWRKIDAQHWARA